MTLEEAFAFGEEVEKRYPVDSWTINNIHIWPIVRLSLGFKCMADISGHKHKKNNTLKLLWTYGERIGSVFANECNVIIKDRIHNQQVVSADVALLTDNGDRNVVMPDGSMMDHNLDPIKLKLEE